MRIDKNYFIAIIFYFTTVNAYGWTITNTMDTKLPSTGAGVDAGAGWWCTQRYANGVSLDGSSGTPDPPNAWKFYYYSGQRDGDEPANCGITIPVATKEIWFEYYFKYSSNWTWHGVNNKHWYFLVDVPNAPQRWIFGIGDQPAGNQSLPRRFRVSTSNIWPDNFYSNTGYNPEILAGVWYKFNGHVIFNTPGQSDGSWQIYLNDKLVEDYAGMHILGSDDPYPNSFNITPVWGGNSAIYKPADEYFWVDKVTISTTPLSGGATKIPRPPKSLSIQL